MSSSADLWIFAGIIVLGQFSPGPDLLLITHAALKRGVRDGLQTALGIGCGLTLHATIAVAGVAVAFQRLPLLRVTLQWLAAAYLLWLAWGMARGFFMTWHVRGADKIEAPVAGRTPFARGLLCNLLNPKVALFLASVCAPFLSGDRPAWWSFAIWGIVVGLGIGLWALWVLLLQWPPLRDRYQRFAGVIDGIFALVLAALAIRLVIGW